MTNKVWTLRAADQLIT